MEWKAFEGLWICLYKVWLLATSDCSTVLIDELHSPEDNENQLLTPVQVVDYRPNPLSTQRWSDSE